MEDIERMKLPEPLLQRNVKMKAYCELRIKSYELIPVVHLGNINFEVVDIPIFTFVECLDDSKRCYF